uniref:Probable phospholipid-transporting ATPase IIB isoform X3 n=1 Tax=Callorhinus ursinus TaxID=34884 RepID=A0A3Q7PUH8_CALUR|nr:probable phospholipid-transporting ATPase IIB isoform X3 [Callorhinus ursinus]
MHTPPHTCRYQLEDESAHLDEMPLMMSEEGFENDESDYHTLPRARITQRRRGLEWFVCGGWKFLCTRGWSVKPHSVSRTLGH